jgi:hypothetical protein
MKLISFYTHRKVYQKVEFILKKSQNNHVLVGSFTPTIYNVECDVGSPNFDKMKGRRLTLAKDSYIRLNFMANFGRHLNWYVNGNALLQNYKQTAHPHLMFDFPPNLIVL